MAEDKNNPYETNCKQDYLDDWDAHRNYISTFDSLEAMLIGQVYDSVSGSVDGSKISDSYAATLAIERAARVMGKLPDGVSEAVGANDAGKAAFMDILRQKWIYPNANAQHNFKTKLELWQLYSSVYGYMPMFYDWNVSKNGYVGPDCWLFNPRNLIPQQGRVSIADMDYVTAITYHSKKTLEDIIENEEEDDGWDREALQELVDAKKTTGTEESEEKTVIQESREKHDVNKGIKLATRYEAGPDGEWVVFAPDHGFIEVRRIENPHKNGRIPFVIKYSQPLFDSFYGLGDFQRAKPLQFARDGLTNFYFKGIKMNLIPPLVVNANGVVKHTVDYREGGVMMETVPNSIRRLETSTAGLNTYQAAQSNLTGSLLSLFGSQNASLPGAETLNPSQGKTPAAIRMYNQKEATRDGQERQFLEQAIEELTDGFYSLLANIGTEDIPLNLFAEDVRAIEEAGLTDVLDLFENFTADKTNTAGELRIKAEALKGAEYRFHITAGSTAKLNKQEQLAQIENILGTVAKYQNVIQEDPNIEINWGKLLNTYEELSEIPGAGDFITIKDGPSPQELALMEQNQQLQMQLEQTVQQAQAAIEEARSTSIAPPTMVAGRQFTDPGIAQAAQQIMG